MVGVALCGARVDGVNSSRSGSKKSAGRLGFFVLGRAKNRLIGPLGLLLADHVLPEFQPDRPACRYRIRRLLDAQYSKRKYQNWFGGS
jgi:hypothetical protein